MTKYSVYLIQSELNQSYYVGMAIDVHLRLKEHNAGKSKYTKAFMPWRLIYFEEIGDASEARKREKYLKSTAGKNFLRKNGII